MTDTTYKTNTTNRSPHGGYRTLKSFQTTTIIYDFTVVFCKTYMTYKTNKSYRMTDQMIQAARSGRQNIAEGSQVSGTSKKSELKLVGVARASLEELLVDYQDFLRQRGLPVWQKDDPSAREIRSLSYRTDKSYKTYETYMEDPQKAANCAICLIHQANYLLDRQLQSLDKSFVEEGGYSENLLRRRLERKRS